MYRVVVIRLFLVVVLAVAEDDSMEQCGKIEAIAIRCCTTMPAEARILSTEDAMECSEKRKPPPSCEAEECVAKKLGYFGDDGKVNIGILTSVMEKRFEKDQVLMDAIREGCVKADFSKLGPPDMCDLRKLNRCVFQQLVDKCAQWDNEGSCKGMKTAIEICLKH